jgi:hypothetical protein
MLHAGKLIKMRGQRQCRNEKIIIGTPVFREPISKASPLSNRAEYGRLEGRATRLPAAFRYSNRVRLGVDDSERTTKALAGIVGKRLYYQQSAWRRVRRKNANPS